VDVDDIEGFLRSYTPPVPSPGRAHLRANMITTLDGSAVGPDGRTGSINTEADRATFARLRGLADVVLVGARTCTIEGYGRPEPEPELQSYRCEHNKAPAAVLAIVSGSLAIPLDAPFLTEGPPPPLIFTCAAAPQSRRGQIAERAEVIIAGDDDVELPVVIDHLVSRGLTQVLSEGGPTLFAGLIRDGLLDELCLTVAPVVVGGHGLGLTSGGAIDTTSFTLTQVLEQDSALLTRWQRQPPT